MKIKVNISSRDYSEYSIEHLEEDYIDVGIDPIEMKLFSGDVINICEDKKFEIVSSPMRNATHVGILKLDDNKTYGRTENKKRLLYKCIPYDNSLPEFLIPYEIQIGFNKSISNKYVVFQFEKWTDKHPRGLLTETIGDVSDLKSFYEYQLYCKRLNHSLTPFTNKAKEWMKTSSPQKRIETLIQDNDFLIQDRREDFVFTIDPPGSMDLDDGFSVNKTEEFIKISIHIANVVIGSEMLNAWNFYSDRVSSIYLPDKIRPMLPRQLSENMFSLLENQDRIAFTMDMLIDKDATIIPNSICFSNTILHVKKNYSYDDEALNKNEDFSILKRISGKGNSHDVVEFWMKFMNETCAQFLFDKKIGIYRSVQYLDKAKIENVLKNEDEYSFILSQWKNIKSEYSLYGGDLRHDLISIDQYAQITSPIRRLVDVINQIYFIRGIMNLPLSEDCNYFIKRWTSRMNSINQSMKSIRKLQNECLVLHQLRLQDGMMDMEYEGMVFDKTEKNGIYHFLVYLKDVKFIFKLKCERNTVLGNYERAKFRIYVFENEDKTRRKLRVQQVL
jgi:exoribonuclease R